MTGQLPGQVVQLSTGEAGPRVNRDIEVLFAQANISARALLEITSILNGGSQSPGTPPESAGMSGAFGPVWTGAFAEGRLINAAEYPADDYDTIRFDGVEWLNSGFLRNTGTQVYVGAPSAPAATFPFQVYSDQTPGAGVPNSIAEFWTDKQNSDPSLSAANTYDNSQFSMGIVSRPGDYSSASTQTGDAVLQINYGVSGVPKLLFNGGPVGGAVNWATLGVSGLYIGGYGTAAGKLDIRPLAGEIGVYLKQAAAPTANLLHFLTSGSADIATWDKDGALALITQNAASVPLTVKGAASQSANLQEWKSSAGTVLASTGPGGGFTIAPATTGTVGMKLNLPGSYAASALQINDSAGNVVGQISTDASGLARLIVRAAASATGANARAVVTLGGYNYLTSSGAQVARFVANTLQGTGTSVDCASLEALAAEAHGAGALGTDWAIAVCPIGSASNTARWRFTANGNTVLNGKLVALATTVTDGFPYLPNMAGTPSGSAAAYAGNTPLVADSTHKTLWFNGGTSNWWSIGPGRVVQTKSAAYTAVPTDDVIVMTGAAWTLTLPAASSVPPGKVLWVKKVSAGVTHTIQRAGSNTIDGAASFTLPTQYQARALMSDGVSGWMIVGGYL